MIERTGDAKLNTFKAYWRAKGLYYKCGERWSHNNNCFVSVPLHLIEEMWAILFM
jgi:hypothetical protein